LAPESIAFVGASTKQRTLGNDMVRIAQRGGYGGRIYPVNPAYDRVEDLACYPGLGDLPEGVDHVVLGLANSRLEEGLRAAIDHGAGAVTIFASCLLGDDSDPPLAARLAAMAREAGIEVCGGNTMGFYNLEDGLRVAGFPAGVDMTPGGITFIAQSGSVFGALAHNDRRLRYNLVVTCGSEFTTTAADYLDWALGRESTRVVGLFLETVRDPETFLTALRKAEEKAIPVVALKVGRTAASAAMARSHSGAVAGNDAAYQAVFERYGVSRVATLDELAASLLLFDQGKRAGSGGLATIHDSGGERELVTDLASDIGVPFAEISEATREVLAARLEPGLEPVNPLDAWGTGHDMERIFEECFAALLADPDCAMGLYAIDLREDYYLHEVHTRILKKIAASSDKPIAIGTNFALTRNYDVARELTEHGVPVLEGTREFLLAVRHLFDYRDFQRRVPVEAVASDPAVVERWRARLVRGTALDEAESLALLSDYGIPAVPHRRVSSAAEARKAALDLGLPVALKTAAEGLHHKSEKGGVRLNLETPAAVDLAYQALSEAFGPAVLVAKMAGPGVEVGVGVVNDPQFGPYIVAAAGGVMIELLDDHSVGLAPLDDATARRMIGRLRVARLLAGARGRTPADLEGLVEVVVRLSRLAHDLRDLLAEADINPIIVGPSGCLAVDALVLPKGA
jgi:acyl-CoA synthetase (NDP forming)